VVADDVVGQPDFGHNDSNHGGLGASSLTRPTGLTLDAQGNSRVLEFDNPLTHDAAADRVFGQPNFSQDTENNSGLGPGSLDNSPGVALDPSGNLFVAD
jgi:hypothetical protein